VNYWEAGAKLHNDKFHNMHNSENTRSYGVKIKEEMGEACRTYGRNGKQYFSVQTGSAAHPFSYAMGAVCSFLDGNAAGAIG
jgi:hypothetical protein